MSTDTPMPSAPEMSTTSSMMEWNPDNIEQSTGDVATPTPETAASETVPTKPTVSPTSYAFPGSALGSDSVQTRVAKESNIIDVMDSDQGDEMRKSKEEDKSGESVFECNICLDMAKDAVVSFCGHLFCWPCLHQWLEIRPNRKLCPVCKAAISKEKVIPLYGRNSTKQEDPRNKVPPRPSGQRTEAEPQQSLPSFGFGDGFYMSFGIGAFPFAYFSSSFNLWEGRPAAANRGAVQYEEEQQLSKLFLYLAFLCIAWLLFA